MTSKANATPDRIFAERVRQKLFENKLNQKDLAKKVGITEAMLSKYIHQKNPSVPNIIVATNIASALKVPLDYLCGVSDTQVIQGERSESAIILLRNLYKVVTDLGINTTLGTNSETIFTSKNQYIYMFFSLLSKRSAGIDLSKILSRFQDLYAHHGNIMDEEEFINMKRAEYTYLERTDDDDYELWAEDNARRNKEFDEALKEGKIL